jgi:hypothetical protein
METAIYATIYINDLNPIEESLKSVLIDGNFKRIEQGTVLLYEDNQTELSIEKYTDSFYLSGRIKNNISSCKELINEIANVLKNAEIKFSLDYQEENEDGLTTTQEFNISNRID